MKRFRKMINVALKNEWMEKDPFRAYKFKFTKYEQGYLTADELLQLEKNKFYQPKTSDFFLRQDHYIFICLNENLIIWVCL